MRILHVYKDVYPPVAGGIERHIDSIRRALPDLRHDVLICGRRLRTRLQASPDGNGTEVLVGEFGRVLSTPIAPTFPWWLAKFAPGAIVHLHMPQPVGELSALVARRGAPLVASYHADIFRQQSLLFLYRPLVLRCLRAADVVLTASEALRDRSPLIREAGVRPRVVGYGIDTSLWADGQVGAALVEQIRARYGGDHVLAVGRLVPYKGFDRLVTAAAALSVPVVIVGEGSSREALESQIASLGLQRKVHLVGRVDDRTLAAHMAAASAFILPSWNRAEAFGIVLLEAQAAGTPVVATDVGTGTTEAFVDGETGFAVPPNDIAALVEAIERLVGDAELRRKMGEAGRLHVERRYSLQRIAENLRPIYDELAARI
jgi:glycosyltransferase involved in cell wall biosynthesis